MVKKNGNFLVFIKTILFACSILNGNIILDPKYKSKFDFNIIYYITLRPSVYNVTQKKINLYL